MAYGSSTTSYSRKGGNSRGRGRGRGGKGGGRGGGKKVQFGVNEERVIQEVEEVREIDMEDSGFSEQKGDEEDDEREGEQKEERVCHFPCCLSLSSLSVYPSFPLLSHYTHRISEALS
jgi:hypothetical protein